MWGWWIWRNTEHGSCLFPKVRGVVPRKMVIFVDIGIRVSNLMSTANHCQSCIAFLKFEPITLKTQAMCPSQAYQATRRHDQDGHDMYLI